MDRNQTPLTPLVTQRKIIHLDCDCFYASIEMRDDPALKDVPLAIGGAADHRGVIATCNYVARAFGVRSAMPSAKALQLCPSLIILPPNMHKYRLASQQILEIYQDYTDLVEPLSLDEAYIDVSKVPRCQASATLMAQEIRQRVKEQVQITISAGVAPNKFLAKIASDWNKPDGLFVIRPQDVDSFVEHLPVVKLHGVGAVTAAKLHNLGVLTCADLRKLSIQTLVQHFGVFGPRLYALSRGQDDREVTPDRQRKSISVETTYVKDIRSLDQCLLALPELLANLQQRILRNQSESLIAKLFVKLRFADFKRTTAECVHSTLNPEAFELLMRQAYVRNRRGVRLIGVGVRLAEQVNVQARLFE